MHELAMAEGMLDIVLSAAGERPVRSVNVRVGRLHAVVPDSLCFSFQLLGDGTAASGAILNLQEVPVSVQCNQCGTIGDCPAPPFQCARCQGADVSIVSGAELVVEEVRLEDGAVLTPDNTLPDVLAAHLAEEHGL